jgi:gliding motility-associated-like protein
MNLYDVFCKDTLSHNVKFIEEPIAKQFILDTICLGQNVETIIYNTNSYFIYTWTDNERGDTLSLGDSLLIFGDYFSESGTREIKLSVSNVCDTVSDSNILVIEKCEIPNVITPNGDGINDFFVTSYAKIYDDVNITILNRWGNVVFEASNYENNWDGNELNDGTYFYFMTYNQGIGKTNGIVQIISE